MAARARGGPPSHGAAAQGRRRTAPADWAPGTLELDHEELVVRRGARSGVYTIVAVHSTALGPALGGCRIWRYSGPMQAIGDALRLSRTMTLKAAAAGLDLGGGRLERHRRRQGHDVVECLVQAGFVAAQPQAAQSGAEGCRVHGHDQAQPGARVVADLDAFVKTGRELRQRPGSEV